MACSFFRRGKKSDAVSPEMSKMNERLSFGKRRSYSLCSSLGSGDREHCWAYCPSLPRFYRREKKHKMVEVLIDWYTHSHTGEQGCMCVCDNRRPVSCL